MMNFRMIYIISSFLFFSTNVEANYIHDVKLSFTPCAFNEIILELEGSYPNSGYSIESIDIEQVGFQFNIIITYLSEGGHDVSTGFKKSISLGTHAPGEYTATIIQNNPLSISWITPEPEENVSVKIYSSPVCKWIDGAATAYACGGSNWSFIWSTGATTHRIENLEPGNYSVTVTADNGSTDSATVIIGRKYQTNLTMEINDCMDRNPIWNVQASTDIPFNFLFPLYQWSNGQSGIGINSVMLNKGTYGLTVTNQTNGCFTVDSFDLKYFELNVEYEGDSVIAQAIGGMPPYKYFWNNGDTTSSIQIQSGELFTVTVTDSLDCVRVYDNRSKAPFVTTWNTALPGSSDNNQITIPGFGTNYSIVWEEIDHPENNDSTIGNNTTVLTFPNPGIYRVSITPSEGTFHRIQFSSVGDTSKILNIDQWGEIEWSSFGGAFKGCVNVNSDASDLPDLNNVSDMSEMFYNCIELNGPSNIGQWDVSQVRDMRGMFRSEIQIRNVFDEFIYYSSFNQEIPNWSVANVTNMSRMFSGASSFNQYIGNWNVSQVRNMEAMFFSAYSFNQNIGSWEVGKVTNLSSMFSSASSFNQEIGSWDVSNVTNMAEMFLCKPPWWTSASCGVFNQDIGDWDVSNVKSMHAMLSTRNFNQNIENWDVSNVTDMSNMFSGARFFNQGIGGWDVSNVTNMAEMFQYASAFDQDIGSWDVANVTNMALMFRSANSFNHNIGTWDVSNVKDMSGMFGGFGGFVTNAFNANIGDWNVSNVTTMAHMFNNASSFNQDIGRWNVSNVTNMAEMFHNASSFNQDIGRWDVSKVNIMSEMFSSAGTFNQDIGSWDVSNVIDMSGMFSYVNSNSFGLGIGKWDVGNVKNMSSMFLYARTNNQDIGNWNVSNVTDMRWMFYEANLFNQDIGNWNIMNVTDMREMFKNTAMKCDNYSSTLIGWNKNSDLTSGINLGAEGMKFGTEAVSARENLKSAHGWTFTGDSPAGIECSMPVSTENSKSGYQINLNPNPFTHQLTVEYSGNENTTIILYDQLSRVVLQQNLYNSATIDTDHLPAGLYIYEIVNEHGTIRSGKLVKM